MSSSIFSAIVTFSCTHKALKFLCRSVSIGTCNIFMPSDCFQESDDTRQAICGRYVLLESESRAPSTGHVSGSPQQVGFEVGRYDSNRALVIDPVLVYSTYLGGSGGDGGFGIAVDPAGNA